MSSSSPQSEKAASDVREDRAVRLLLEATASQTGRDFFRALVRNLAQALGTSAAWVTEYLPEEGRLRSLAMWADGRDVDDYEYAVSGTPCEPVIHNCSLAHFEDRLIELFPRDPDLPAMRAISYIGAPFSDASGRLLGHVAAIDTKPMPKSRALAPVVELFAARAGAEYMRERAESALRDREAQLSRLLDTAMDAIIMLDEALRITHVNPAALSTFACEADDLLAERLEDFLAPASARRVVALVQTMLEAPATERRVWIPDGIEALRWNREKFPAEATLSHYEFKGKACYTLILRNIDERITARRKIQRLSQEAKYMKSALEQAAGEQSIIGACPAMQRLLDGVRRVAATDATALILGETGTGKELVAREIHRASLRRNRPLVCVNCGAIPEALMESTFFGHEKGAFTGASDRRIGLFERANSGTLFLDEAGELPAALQAKLLRALQDGEIERIGGTKPVKVDVRVIAATHRDLEAMVKTGTFREDLFYRLNVFPLTIPPLRERGDDVVLLANAFLGRLGARMGRAFEPLSESDQALLRAYHWPGNARELQNVIERAIIQSSGKTLALGLSMPHGLRAPGNEAAQPGPGAEKAVYSDAQMRDFEKRNIIRALEASGGAVFGPEGAAARLGVKPTTLASRIKKLGIKDP